MPDGALRLVSREARGRAGQRAPAGTQDWRDGRGHRRKPDSALLPSRGKGGSVEGEEASRRGGDQVCRKYFSRSDCGNAPEGGKARPVRSHHDRNAWNDGGGQLAHGLHGHQGPEPVDDSRSARQVTRGLTPGFRGRFAQYPKSRRKKSKEAGTEFAASSLPVLPSRAHLEVASSRPARRPSVSGVGLVFGDGGPPALAPRGLAQSLVEVRVMRLQMIDDLEVFLFHSAEIDAL